MKAVIDAGGNQHIVEKGTELVVDRITTDKKTVSYEALFVFDEKTNKIGAPTVKGAKVTAEIVEPEMKGEKIKIRKFQRKKRVNKLTGHRQPQTKIRIKTISVK